MSPAQVRLLSAGAAGVLSGGLLAVGFLEAPWCGPLGVLCLMWLAVLVWLGGE